MSIDLWDKMKVIKLDYGNVEIDKTVIKTIEIWNESCKDQIYQVQRDPTTNPLDHVFHFRSYAWTLAPEEKFLCEIRYRPLIAFSTNVDYFIIRDTSGACMKIIVHGSSIGPEVTCSVTKIFMYCMRENIEVKRRIKLTNNSKVAATFMFNIDKKYKPFQLDIRYGIINPCSYKYITITFTSLKRETYTYYLTILILHQEPIIIELHGSLSLKKDDTVLYPWKEKSGFKGYMTDVLDALEDLPPVSLSKHYFNFGQRDVDLENVQKIPHAMCLTNHHSSNLLISWEKDTEEIFDVIPSEMLVYAGHSALFELMFNPNVKSNLFGREIIGSVFMEHKKLLTFPFVISVTVIGHSFPVASNGWIPQYEIPQIVIMPPCIPSFPVYTTFLIKKFGHLPLMYQFVSPIPSHFTVKPMLGIIYQDYQIITVEMAPESKNEQIYIERWTIYFNGNLKNESYIDFKGYAEHANIIFNNNNMLKFSPVLPGCQQFALLGMRNVTRHRIKYQFYELPPELDMQHLNGEIDANDTLFQECYFSPVEPNVNYEFEVKCVLIIVKNGVTIGSKCCKDLHVHGKCKIGLLQAIPEELNFGELEYNKTKTLYFDLLNSSSVNIYYKLICSYRNWPFENLEEDVKLHPLSETIFSGTRKKITVSITPHTPIYYEFAIQYLIRINYRSDTLVTEQNPIRICNVFCMCILPTIKVQNIYAFGYKQKYSPNIRKPFLWKLFQIHNLNKDLVNMLPGKKKVLNINLFPMIVNEGNLLIEWIIKNSSRLPVSLVLKRIKQCSCEPVIRTTRCSLQRINTDCIHKDVCVIRVKSKTIEPGEETVITMKIQFTLIGRTTTCWDLDIGHNRHIILNVIINCLSKSESQDRFLCHTSLNFGKIYFGNKEGAYRVHWMYNVTNNDLPYSINDSNIRKINEDYQYEVFSCLTQSGIIKAGAAIPFLLKFQPRMFGAYKVTFPVTMGDKIEELTVTGESSFDARSLNIGRVDIPFYCHCKTSLFPAYFSIDSIDMWCIPTNTCIVRMVLIYNILEFDSLAYEWRCQDISEIAYIDVFPRKGIMRPNAVQSFRIKIYTKGCPCRVNISLPCVFFNASKRREYQRSIIKHSILSKELKGQFTITEKGTYVPKPWIKILDKPEEYHKTLCLRGSIYAAEDKQIRVNLLEELKAAPLDTIYFNDKRNYNISGKNERFIATFLLEKILWDIVNSKKFNKVVEDSLFPERNLYYSQFTMDLWERKRLIRRTYISPPLTLINLTLEQILFVIVHEEFSLRTTHLIPDEDIRHSNYLKMLPKQRRTDLDENSKKDENECYENISEEEDEEEDLRTGFRVSFME